MSLAAMLPEGRATRLFRGPVAPGFFRGNRGAAENHHRRADTRAVRARPGLDRRRARPRPFPDKRRGCA